MQNPFCHAAASRTGSQAASRITGEHQRRYAIAITVLNISRYAQYHNGFSHQLVFQCTLS